MLPLLSIVLAQAADAPVLVTSLRGNAVMIDGDKRQPAPASPFLLAPGQVLGRTDEATEDRFITPYAWPWMQAPDMAGVEVQAHAIDALLVGALQAPP